jgi:uracil-DNA glycosylase
VANELPYEFFPDLCDPTARSRFFSGQDPAVIARELPMLPVDAPGIPPPGPSYMAHAQMLGDPPLAKPARGKPKARPAGTYLHALVRSSLYHEPGVTVPVALGDGTFDSVPRPGALAVADGRFDYGPGPCRLMVFGKCLGAAEGRLGRPFSGHGSRPLWEAWDELGMPRPGAHLPTFMSNLIPFELPPAVKTLPRDWILDGVHLFFQQFALCRPEHLLILGADALKAVFGNKAKVEDYRGRAATLRVDCRPTADHPEDWHEAVVTVVDHPAKVARDPDAYPEFLAGMRFAASRMGLCGRPDTVPTDHKAVYTIDELRREVDASVAASAGGGYVSFDAEWEGHDHTHPDSYVYTVQWSHAPGHGRAVFLRRCGGVPNPDMPPDQAAAELRRLLADAPARGARLVAHFGKADLPWLEAKVGVDLYPHYVGPADDPGADGVDPAKLFGWQKTYFEGGFDSYVGAHAVDETQPLKLEVILAAKLGLERYDGAVLAWRDKFCKDNKISRSKLKGYGHVPEDVICPYGCYDADGAGRLYLYLNGDPRDGSRGALDADAYGNSSREIFAIRMRAWAAAAEIERYGVEADCDRHRELRDVLVAKRDELVTDLQTQMNWLPDPADPDDKGFDPARRVHRVEFLFGEGFTDGRVMKRPPGALCLYLQPHKATASGDGRLWADAVARAARQGLPGPSPAADKETLIVLSRSHQLVGLLKDIDFVNTALKGLLRPPKLVDVAEDETDGPEEWEDPDVVGELNARAVEVFDRGFMHHRCHDGRVRTVLGLVETGRYSSSRPNLQNCFPPHVEVLTRQGWVRFDALSDDAEVAQFDPHDESVAFTRPTAVIRQDYAGDLLTLKTDEQIQLTMTPDHRVLTRNRKTKSWRVTAAAETPSDALYYQAGVYVGGTTRMERALITLLAATQADGNFSKSEGLRFGFNKKRKYDRLTAALRSLGVGWTEPNSASNYVVYLGQTTDAADLIAWLKGRLTSNKVFGPWLLDLDRAALDALVEELTFWDGCYTRGTEYYSSQPVNADWAQTLFALSGVRANRRVYHNGNPNSVDLHVVALPGRRVAYSMTTNAKKTATTYAGKVYCVTVPTGFILVRDGLKISVTGNCSDGVNEQFNRIMGWTKKYAKTPEAAAKKFVSRSIIRAKPGWLLVNADLMGAEIATAAWFSGDRLLIDHARRNTLPEDHPDYLDLHADLAKRSFGLEGTLAEIKEKFKHLRVGAKRSRFGHYYGASPDTILRKAQEESADITLEQIQAIVHGHDEAHPTLAAFFATARGRVSRPGHLCNGFGGRRRFRPSRDRDLLAGQEREAQNWTCQGLVADAVANALGELWLELRLRQLRSRIVLTVHDSIMLECPLAEVALVHDVLLPLCMSERTAIVPTDFDGNPVLGRGPYHFGIDREVCVRWGEKLEEAEWRRMCEEAAAQAA